MNVVTMGGVSPVSDGSGGWYFIPAGSVGTPVSMSYLSGGGYNILVSCPTLHFGADGLFIGYDVADVQVDSGSLQFAPMEAPAAPPAGATGKPIPKPPPAEPPPTSGAGAPPS